MKKLKSIISFFAFLVFIFLFSSCSSEGEKKNPKDALSAFLNEEDDIVAFGNISVNDLLVKANYSSVPTFGTILKGQVEDWEGKIDLDFPIFYAIQGPVDDTGKPETIYAFIKIIDKEAILSKLSQDGYDFNEVKGISYAEDGPVLIGFSDEVGVIIIKNDEFDSQKLISETFQKIQGQISGGVVDDILGNDGDLVLGMNVEALYSSSEIDLSSLSESKQNDLKELVKDSYVQTIFKFEDGAAIIETKNIFSSKLKDKLFFNTGNSTSVKTYLGSGEPRMGFSMDFDMKKMNDFINEFSPEAISDLAKSIGPQAQIALMFSGKDGLAAFLDGRIGVVVAPDFSGNSNYVYSDYNAFIGLTKKGKELVKDFGGSNLEYAKMILNDEGIVLFNSESSENKSQQNDLVLPEGCEEFGQSALSFFVNFDGVNMDNLNLEGEANILRAIKYITFDYTNEGGVLYIKAKEGQENILKQAMDIMIEEYSTEMSQLAN